ncbi:hypothetical protein [Actinomadura sp. 21ATH]|uniref:hypothetical protein n=1 Tax=Actinomadura sp. 21ATH TaxID=1735444 RepID=UPI0035C01EF3
MADAMEDQKRDRVDDLMVHVARGRIALGAAALVAPGLSARALGAAKPTDGGRDLAVRMFAAREIALGAGYLLSKDPDRVLWARMGLVVDSLDAASGLRSRRTLPLWRAAAAVALAGGVAAAGAAKVAKDIVR